MRYNLPRETAKILNQVSPVQHLQNLGLLLDKYVPAEVVDKEEAIDKKKDQRGNWLRNIVERYRIDDQLAGAAYQRWGAYTRALGAVHFNAAIDWRMIVGFGGNGVLETDLTLHHIYGLPIIPGSALKGLARTYAAMEDRQMYVANSDSQLKPSTEISTDHKEIRRIFGTQEQTGTVIFFDAFPADGQWALVLDIMNPHYPKYYQKKEIAPTNDQNPVPITFLAIEHTSYTFALASRQGISEEYKSDLGTASFWLKEALQKYGIGGKTSSGYGYFQKPTDPSASSSPSQAMVSSKNSSNLYPPQLQPSTTDSELQLAQGFKNQLEKLKESEVAGQIQRYYDRWRKVTSEEARKMLALAIIEKVRETKREKASIEKTWYKELQAFLGKI